MNMHGLHNHGHNKDKNNQIGSMMSLPKGGIVINTAIGKI
jgi:hypothetical protein